MTFEQIIQLIEEAEEEEYLKIFSRSEKEKMEKKKNKTCVIKITHMLFGRDLLNKFLIHCPGWYLGQL